MNIGRLDLIQGLKRYFEIVGKTGISLGEGVVPVVSIGDLGVSPFAPAVEWYLTATLTGGVGTNGFIAFQGLDPKIILTLETIRLVSGVADPVDILLSSFLGGSALDLRHTKFIGTRDSVGSANANSGASALGAPAGYEVVPAFAVTRLPTFAVGGPSLENIAVILTTTNTVARYSFTGHIHRTSSI